uniref:Integrin alpha-2 domain-containing protein n=1 Tax=Periophthalmus magnuspinnatus TaxID=409849 RepID=A0A3B4ACB9_9GOBI
GLDVCVCASGSLRVLMASSAPVLLSMLLAVCTAFNLDPLVSVVKSGGRRSLFGFSVALHQDQSSGAYRLLVGAPMERAEPGVLANRTGGVYVCPISSDPGDCTRDLIEDMWLGVSVASQGPPGGRVLACGHRFAKLYGAYRLRHMTGRCYVRGNHLQYNDSDAHWQNPDQVCSGEVMCTMGMSAAISQTEIIVGSPGSFDWQGTSKNTASHPKPVQASRGGCVYSYVCAGNVHDDARGSVFLALKSSSGLQILQRLRGEQTGSYYGNALAVLDLNNDGWNDLLVGAPFFFQRLEEVGGAVYVYLNTGGRFDSRPTLVLRGPQHSAFGMSLCAAGDLDQDGFQGKASGQSWGRSWGRSWERSWGRSWG